MPAHSPLTPIGRATAPSAPRALPLLLLALLGGIGAPCLHAAVPTAAALGSTGTKQAKSARKAVLQQRGQLVAGTSRRPGKIIASNQTHPGKTIVGRPKTVN